MRRFKAVLANNGPVVILAVIAAVGSFDHISSLAVKYGQKDWRAWAVAVCIDLMCVMAASELQRDKRTRRRHRGVMSWPALVLMGGIVLTLAANLAQAPASAWGWILAATPAGAFLIAVSMLERRAVHHSAGPEVVEGELVADRPDGTASAPVPSREPARTELAAEEPPAQLAPASGPEDGPAVSDALLDDARYIAGEHARLQGSVITADQLGRRLRVGPDLADHLLTRITTSGVGAIPPTAKENHR